MSLKHGRLSNPSTLSAVVSKPKRAARAKPSEFGSTPTIAPISTYLALRMILIIRSVPILPEPMMALLIFDMFFSLNIRWCKDSSHGTKAFNLHMKFITWICYDHWPQSAGQHQITFLQWTAPLDHFIGQPYCSI